AFFIGLDLHSETNNKEHRTSEISVKELIVRRGQAFKLTLRLAPPFRPAFDQLTMTVVTGRPFIPSFIFQRSGSAKAVWRAELQRSSSPETGVLVLAITPPAACPVGEYKMSAKLGEEERDLATLSVLFNPWCPEDWVFLPDEAERQEYVMNEHGIIYKGVDKYIDPTHWDFGQFEEDMVKICMKILDYNVKHKQDPADDVSARCNPIYVSRVVTCMINSENGGGILKGQWGMDFRGGVPPTHWSGSYAILKKWSNSVFSSVKYGQCWVYAAVMCSERLDVFGPVFVIVTKCYFTHAGMFCCGPAPVSAIRNGDTHLKYDIPFVFAEVNADCITWLVKRDGSMVNIETDSIKIGQNISTKSVGTNNRMNITDSYKQKEAVITDQQKKNHMFLAETRIVLMKPPISITVFGESRVNREMTAEVLFQNPVKEILRDCSLTLTGSGLFNGELITRLPDLLPNNRVRVKFHFVPYRSGDRTLLVDFDCASFRDIKKSCTVIVKP
uniref:Transglutaminase-like domain-containing protein n=1 Tax=Xiphophorus couchianus TaxID=32473 RepID=A0A3B5MI63_9TELE